MLNINLIIDFLFPTITNTNDIQTIQVISSIILFGSPFETMTSIFKRFLWAEDKLLQSTNLLLITSFLGLISLLTLLKFFDPLIGVAIGYVVFHFISTISYYIKCTQILVVEFFTIIELTKLWFFLLFSGLIVYFISDVTITEYIYMNPFLNFILVLIILVPVIKLMNLKINLKLIK